MKLLLGCLVLAAGWAAEWNGVPQTSAEWTEDIKALGENTETVHAGADDARFTASGHFMAPLNTVYNPAQAKSCCSNACDGEECQNGCDMWLHSSSLNWESTKWWEKLKMRCQRDCMQSVEWRKVDVKKPGVDKGWKEQMDASYWSDEKARKTDDIAQCQAGCAHYKDCMNAGHQAEYAVCTCTNGKALTEACLKDNTERCHHCEKGYYLTHDERCEQATCDNGVISRKDVSGETCAQMFGSLHTEGDKCHAPYCTCNEGYVGGGIWQNLRTSFDRHEFGSRTFPPCDPIQ